MTEKSERSFPILTNFDDDAALSRNLSEEIAECLRQAIRERGYARVVLSGGTTPQKTYLFLSKQDVNWERVEITLADERWVPSSHPRSNHCLLNMTLFEPLGAKPRFVPLYRDNMNPADAIGSINEALEQIARPFDLVLLGMGHDGHTASLFPQGDQLAESLDLSDSLLARVINAPGATEPRVTLTLRALLDARRIILAFSGQKKFETFEKALEDGPVQDMPIRAVLRQAQTPVDVFYSIGVSNSTNTDKPGYGLDPAAENICSEARGVWSVLRDKPITDLFDRDPGRFNKFSVELGDMLLDYSKCAFDEKARDCMVRLARNAGLEEKRESMFSGHHINRTEGRAVGHAALRTIGGGEFWIDGSNVIPDVLSVLERMKNFAEDIRAGRIKTSTGETFTDVVNIGIGGSDLGPAMVCRALSPYCDGPAVHFVSNIDGAHITDVLKNLDPRRTLIIIASKTFTTIETITNANTARRWMSAVVGEDKVGEHFAAISSAVEKAQAFGIGQERVFGYWDWVGGRYSVWGPIGLPVMIATGYKNFYDFLRGAAEMDEHFRTAPLDKNMPVMMGLLGVWHHNICGYSSRAILPYDQRLERFTAYVQQLDMESNGKSVSVNGERIRYKTGPVVWGEPGTNGQHAFYQLLHQGAQIIPTEFLIASQGHEPELKEHHDLLVSNALAQAEALMKGRTSEQALQDLLDSGASLEKAAELAPHKTFQGRRPSLMIMYSKLDPFTLGRIIALYEHRVFVEGAVWDINSFDQWGVELGKEMAKGLYPYVRDGGGEGGKFSESTSELLKWCARIRKSGDGK